MLAVGVEQNMTRPLIQRYGLLVVTYRIEGGHCPRCGRPIPVIGGLTLSTS